MWEVTIAKAENGDLIIPLPDEVLALLGVKEGDEIEWTADGNGGFVLAPVALKNTPKDYDGIAMAAVGMFCLTMAVVADKFPNWTGVALLASFVAVGVSLYITRKK